MNVGRIQGRGSAERVTVDFVNAQGATITLGYPVCLTTLAASADGAKAVLPVAGSIRTFLGIALSDVPNNAVGTALAYGFCNSVAIFATGASTTVTLGDAMGCGASSLGVNSTGLLETYGPVVAMSAIGAAICSPGGYAKGFVRNI